MAVHEISRGLSRAVNEIVELFLTDQPIPYIAEEFLVSSNVQRAMPKSTKLRRALLQAEKTYGASGFGWVSPPVDLVRILERTKHLVERAAHTADNAEAKELVRKLIADADPDFLSDINVH